VIPAVGCRHCLLVPCTWPPCPRNGPGGSPPPEDAHTQQPGTEPWPPPIRDTAIQTYYQHALAETTTITEKEEEISALNTRGGKHAFMYVCI
jgi:hypothetical protein